jgi:hypothetical protein
MVAERDAKTRKVLCCEDAIWPRPRCQETEIGSQDKRSKSQCDASDGNYARFGITAIECKNSAQRGSKLTSVLDVVTMVTPRWSSTLLVTFQPLVLPRESRR